LSKGVISVSDASAIIYGVLLIVFLLAEPRGVVGLGHRIWMLSQRRRRIPAIA
jgi:hypothetical protein